MFKYFLNYWLSIGFTEDQCGVFSVVGPSGFIHWRWLRITIVPFHGFWRFSHLVVSIFVRWYFEGFVGGYNISKAALESCLSSFWMSVSIFSNWRVFPNSQLAWFIPLMLSFSILPWAFFIRITVHSWPSLNKTINLWTSMNHTS